MRNAVARITNGGMEPVDCDDLGRVLVTTALGPMWVGPDYIELVDRDNQFAATTVEGALQELRAHLATLQPNQPFGASRAYPEAVGIPGGGAPMTLPTVLTGYDVSPGQAMTAAPSGLVIVTRGIYAGTAQCKVIGSGLVTLRYLVNDEVIAEGLGTQGILTVPIVPRLLNPGDVLRVSVAADIQMVVGNLMVEAHRIAGV